MEEWLLHVHDRPELSSAKHLPRAELLDHLPKIIDDMVALIQLGSTPKEDAHTVFIGKTHARHRWAQHYRVDELLREIGVLQRIIHDEIARFQQAHPKFNAEGAHRIRMILGRFLDEIAVTSVNHFVAHQQAQLEEDRRTLACVNQEIQHTNEELKAQDAARMRLLRTTSHELRNALNQLNLISRTLLREEDSAMREKMLHMLQRSIDHMGTLVEHMLDLSPLITGHEPLRISSGDLSSVGEELEVSFRALAAMKGLKFTWSIDPELKTVITDEEKLRRIITNLVANSVKFTEDGQVDLEMRILDDDTWSLTVTDSGPGIPKEHLSRIFEEFHRVPGTAHHPGYGLGLAITKELVHLLGGRIEITSELGEGTLVRIILPRGQTAGQ